jgi:2-keto-3-deoxy-L-rhamnonate aldolase RhmA|tara:strand:- start:12650 stop:13462 length:813 start_codon:yes stop_codon:yes gene_type:complete
VSAENLAENPVRTSLASGDISLGMSLRQARTPAIAEVARRAGFDFLFLDLEHGSLSTETAAEVSFAALQAGIASFVRIPEGQDWIGTQILNAGATGVIAPHVNTKHEAEAVVARHKFPPLGQRSFPGPMGHFAWGRVPRPRAVEMVNAATVIVAQIESPEAVANAREIAAVDGIDILMVGVGDLSQELGVAPDSPDVEEAIRTVADASEANGKWAGFGGVADPDRVADYVGLGARFVLAGNEMGFLIAGASNRVRAIRERTDAARSEVPT